MRVATSSLIFQPRARAAPRVSNIQVLHRLSSGFPFQEKLVETVYTLECERRGNGLLPYCRPPAGGDVCADVSFEILESSWGIKSS